MRTFPVLVALWLAPAAALANDEATAPPARDGAAERDPGDAAKQLLAEGNGYFQDAKFAEALDRFHASYQLSGSPNARLMMARALARLGRKCEAAGAYAEAEKSARDRSGSEPRYRRTAHAAANELGVLRASLGAVQLRLTGAQAGAKLYFNGVERPIDGDMTLYSEPGDAAVVVKSGGRSITRRLTLRGGEEQSVQMAVPPPPAAPPGWTLPATIGAGATAVVGISLFAVLTARAKSIEATFERSCSPTCEPIPESDRKAAETASGVATGSLVVGLVAAAATAGLLTYHLVSHRAPGGADHAIVVGPGFFGVTGSF